MRIYHNIPALNAYNNLSKTTNMVNKSLERLSSGLRINRAADDAAGLAISEKMRAQVKGLDQAVRNAQDGISLIQTAEGALNETHSILQRMRELSVQAANDTYTASDRVEIQKEIDQLKVKIDRIGNTTEFNTKKLLDGSTSALTSTDKLSTKVFMRDGLRTIDQFGQKAAGGGNFKLEITATPGTNQIQKTDIFKVKHEVAGSSAIDSLSGITAFTSTGAPAGNYTVSTTNQNTADANAYVDGQFQQNKAEGFGLVTNVEVNDAANETDNASMYFEVTAIDLANDKITVTAKSHQYDTNGLYSSITKEGIVLTGGGGTSGIAIGNITLDNLTLADTNHFTVGDRFGINVVAKQAVGADKVSIISDSGRTRELVLADGKWDNKTTSIKTYYVDSAAGEVKDAEFSIAVGTLEARPAIENFVKGATSNLTGVTGNNLQAATNYIITEKDTEAAADSSAKIEKQYAQLGENIVNGVTVGAANAANANILFEVMSKDDNSITVRARSHQVKDDGTLSTTDQILTLTAGATAAAGVTGVTGLNITWLKPAKLPIGDKFTINTVAQAADDDDSITVDRYYRDPVTGVQDDTSMLGRKYVLNGAASLNNMQLGAFELNSTTGVVHDTKMTLAGGVAVDGQVTTFQTAAKYAVEYTKGANIGDIASLDTQLRDIDKFWDASGNFLLANAQKLTLVQGDGKKAEITLFGTDTIAAVRDKLNDAIARTTPDNGLGQSTIVGSANSDKFVSFVQTANADGHEALAGTFVIRSAVAGEAGKLNFIGDEEVIKALSLTTIQGAVDNKYEVDVTNAHTGEVVASDVRISGNKLIGAVHQNVDVEFDNNTGIKVTWDADARDFRLTGGAGNKDNTFVHLADNTTVFQIGANRFQDVAAAIGDMRSAALGIDKIVVTDRISAGDAITTVDNAIGRVSGERSKMGALQNRLEHTINNLTVSSENLAAAESRIRDVDMAKEMMEFTKWNILSQAGNAMLAQANQRPQMVLQLLG